MSVSYLSKSNTINSSINRNHNYNTTFISASLWLPVKVVSNKSITPVDTLRDEPSSLRGSKRDRADS